MIPGCLVVWQEDTGAFDFALVVATDFYPLIGCNAVKIIKNERIKVINLYDVDAGITWRVLHRDGESDRLDDG